MFCTELQCKYQSVYRHGFGREVLGFSLLGRKLVQVLYRLCRPVSPSQR